MAFSESFDLGDSTFMKLQNTTSKVAKNVPECTREIIKESPTKNRRNCSNHSRFIGSRDRSRFQRSKSDNSIGRQQASSCGVHCNSALFRSDITFSVEKTNDVVESRQDEGESDSYLRVSQIEAAFLECDEQVVDEIFKFEVPIFSDDVAKIIETEEPSGSNHSVIANGEDEEIPWLDETSFISRSKCSETSAAFVDAQLRKSHWEISARNREISLHVGEENVNEHITPKRPNTAIHNVSIHQQHTKEPKKPEIESNSPTVSSSQQVTNGSHLKSMSAWNLPYSVLQAYARKGVLQMFDWQVECLSNPKVLFDNCNLVYSAPTSAGKTLVSEILLLKTVLERGKKALLILPFISVVREKMFYLQDLLTEAGYRVEGFFGGYTPPGGFESIHVAICTIEKANSIVNRLLEQSKLEEIGTVVVDEVHLISDPGRGYILELLLAKILYMSRKYGYKIQIITMSATLSNVDLLKRWLDAELYTTNFRPVLLSEMIKIGTQIYDSRMTLLRDVTHIRKGEKETFPPLPNDSDHVFQLCMETLLDSCSVIVFCPSKDWCENLSKQLAGAIHSLIRSGNEWGVRIRAQLKFDKIIEMKQQLRDIPTGLDAVLEKTITYGCAFHHAGLTMEERDIVEASFKSGTLKIITATSTLSSGVNLPARRVIIRSPLFGGKPMNSLTYRQMIGRAGRMGKDTMGEAILICTDSNARIGRELIQADLKPINSCLEMDSSTHLKRALLEVISSGVAASKDDIASFANCTLLSVQKLLREENDVQIVGDSLNFLLEYEFIRLQTDEETKKENYMATRLGMACLASSMPPTDGLILFAELQKSRRCFVLESELHAVYLVTPYSVCYQLQDLDWLFFLDTWERLSPAMKKVGELVGVKESFLVRAMRGQANLDYKMLQIHKRFYTALALQELVEETPISTVALKYKCTRGLLQSLQQMAATFAGIVTAFCNSLQWSTLSLVVSQFRERLFFGVQRDLIDLLRLPDLNHKRARALFDTGITTLVELANSDVFEVEKILHDLLSFDSDKRQEHENEFEAQQRKQERNFFITGRAGLTVPEAAKLLIQEARTFVQLDLGVNNINWSQSEGGTLHLSHEEQQQKTKHGIHKRKSTETEIPSEPKLAKLNNCTKKQNVKSAEVSAEESPAISINVKDNNATETVSGRQRTTSSVKKNEQEGTTLQRSTSKDNIQIASPIAPAPIKPASSERVALRRSSRNISTKAVSDRKSGDMDDLFLDNSFELNSVLNEALAAATPDAVVFKKPKSTAVALNRSSDEIPSSQPPEEEALGCTSASRHQSRFMRSMRTQSTASPTATRTPNAVKKRTAHTEIEAKRTSLSKQDAHNSSIELSDLSMENSLMQQPMLLNASHILSCSKVDTDAATFQSVDIIDICGHAHLFDEAFKELHAAKRFGFCIGLQQHEHKRKPLIGGNLLLNQMAAAERQAVTADALLFSIDDSIYLACVAFCLGDNVVYYMNMQNEGSCAEVDADCKSRHLCQLLQSDVHTLLTFDAKEQVKALRKALPQLRVIRAGFEDPKIASWLLQPDSHFTLQQLAQQYAPECAALVKLCGSGRGYNSFGLDTISAIVAKVRSTIEACATLHILRGQMENLERIGTGQLGKFFVELEMPLQLLLANMEHVGFAVSESAMRKLFERMVDAMKQLEKRIYELHGSRFNLGSSQAVARVLGLHRKSNGRVSTSRQILEKVETPIAQSILAYRKLSTILAKSVQPLLKNMHRGRIHGHSITHTATGRISMVEPNLQNVAKEFDVELNGEKLKISCRSVFKPDEAQKRCLLSSDFCQLEMRILAHMSQDAALIAAMKSDKDVFTVIAARWNKTSEDDVTEQLRNGTKQICYAIVYGMGMGTLAEALKCTKQEAQLVTEQFYAAYPGIRIYAEKILKHARQNGYVETITGRRRYLEHINSGEPQVKSQAERQAINSTIQGSAADIAKSAMLRMERNIVKYGDKLGVDNDAVHLVLHLHDELIFEVPTEKARKIAKLLSVTMENCVKLSVPLKVKLKIGRSWGELDDVKLLDKR